MVPQYIQKLLETLDRGGLHGAVPAETLMEYNHALRVAAGMELANEMDVLKSASAAGYGLQGVPFDSESIPGADYSPLMAQSIQVNIDNLTYTRDDLTISQLFATANCITTTHEWVQRESYGEDGLTLFAAEGSVAPMSKSKFKRLTLNVYHLMEVREYTDVANHVGLMGGLGNARAIELNDGSLNFLRKKEHAYLWADSACNELGFTGIFPSLLRDAPAFVIDCRGKIPTPQEINTYISFLREAPQLADRTKIKAITSIAGKRAFNNAAIPFSRVDGLAQGKVMDYDFVNSRFDSGVTLQDAVYFDHQRHPWGKKVGTAPPPEFSTLNPALAAIAAPAGSKWTTAETNSAWDYYYWAELHGDGGFSSSGVLGPVTPASAQAIRFRVDNPSDRDGDGGGKFVSLYRARVPNGAAAPTTREQFEWIMDRSLNTVNSGDTEIVDLNETLPGTTNMLIGEFSPRVQQVVQLMDTYLRPLVRSMATTNPFAMVGHESFKLKMANKMIWLRNMGRNA